MSQGLSWKYGEGKEEGQRCQKGGVKEVNDMGRKGGRGKEWCKMNGMGGNNKRNGNIVRSKRLRSNGNILQ